MGTRVVERIDSWDKCPFECSFDRLQALADSEFSGVVCVEDVELYITLGMGVGVRGSEPEVFSNGSGSIYDAPVDSLPVLAIMQELQATQEAQYYTGSKSIADAHHTLSDSGFTGYIELSEDILSGDYYVVYHTGNAKTLGFIGEAGRLIAGDEAFGKANDEVGIYSVRTIELSPFELTEPPINQATKNSGTKIYEPENSGTQTRIFESDNMNNTTRTTVPPDVNNYSSDQVTEESSDDTPELSFCPSCGLSLSCFPKAEYCPDCGVDLSYYRP